MIGVVVLKQKNIYKVKVKNTTFFAEVVGKIKHSNDYPIVGDIVELRKKDNVDRLFITSYKTRKNMLIRPLVANVDYAIIVSAMSLPKFSTYLLDKMLGIIEFNNIKPILLFTKSDEVETTSEVYKKIDAYSKDGYKTIIVSEKNKKTYHPINKLINKKISVITGQTGVGKSTTINALNPNFNQLTQKISLSLNRGKHTTREVVLLEIKPNTFIIDTPGFSSFDFYRIAKRDLAMSYHDFKIASKLCRFSNCLHISEPNCMVKKLVEKGKISRERYDNYIELLDEIV